MVGLLLHPPAWVASTSSRSRSALQGKWVRPPASGRSPPPPGGHVGAIRCTLCDGSSRGGPQLVIPTTQRSRAFRVPGAPAGASPRRWAMAPESVTLKRQRHRRQNGWLTEPPLPNCREPVSRPLRRYMPSGIRSRAPASRSPGPALRIRSPGPSTSTVRSTPRSARSISASRPAPQARPPRISSPSTTTPCGTTTPAPSQADSHEGTVGEDRGVLAFADPDGPDHPAGVGHSKVV